MFGTFSSNISDIEQQWQELGLSGFGVLTLVVEIFFIGVFLGAMNYQKSTSSSSTGNELYYLYNFTSIALGIGAKFIVVFSLLLKTFSVLGGVYKILSQSIVMNFCISSMLQYLLYILNMCRFEQANISSRSFIIFHLLSIFFCTINWILSQAGYAVIYDYTFMILISAALVLHVFASIQYRELKKRCHILVVHWRVTPVTFKLLLITVHVIFVQFICVVQLQDHLPYRLFTGSILDTDSFNKHIFPSLALLYLTICISTLRNYCNGVKIVAVPATVNLTQIYTLSTYIHTIPDSTSSKHISKLSYLSSSLNNT